MTARDADELHLIHGHDGYRNHGCRCPICRQANADVHHRYMAVRRDQQAKHRERMAKLAGSKKERPDQECPKCGQMFRRVDLHWAQARRRAREETGVATRCAR